MLEFYECLLKKKKTTTKNSVTGKISLVGSSVTVKISLVGSLKIKTLYRTNANFDACTRSSRTDREQAHNPRVALSTRLNSREDLLQNLFDKVIKSKSNHKPCIHLANSYHTLENGVQILI
jgi:hypothetical protein